jgi:hypothetical protein
MYLFYIDEAGNRDPKSPDRVYALTAIGLYENRWKKFYRFITNHKRLLIDKIYREKNIRLELADCEIKSNWVRRPAQRKTHKFLSHLTRDEIQELVDKYYNQLQYHYMVIITIIIDKEKLEDYMDHSKIHRKAWELLCERVENYMVEYHDKHNAVLITDDMSQRENRSLAMKHAYFLDNCTSCGLRLRHIMEMPLFVRSELSEGVQLADLCSYNFYRAFRCKDMNYSYFKLILPSVYSSQNTAVGKIDGLKIFPESSELINLI